MGIVLITGASRGIGARLAQGLAASGHRVYAGMRRPAPLAHEAAGENLRAVELDVTDPRSVREAVARVDAECGRIDALVNNAGVAWFAPAEEMSEDVLRTTMETNFFGAVRCTQEVLPLMRRQGAGRIAMISTLAAAVGLPLESAYCASKSALEAFAESVRHEVDRFGIQLAVIEPGITEGGLSTSILDPHGPKHSAYQPLLDHTFAYYEAAQADLESPDLITEAVGAFVEGRSNAFRTRLGDLAPLIHDVTRASDADAAARVREALGIEWWGIGKEAPPSV